MINPYLNFPGGVLTQQLTRYTGGWSGESDVDTIDFALQRLDNLLWWGGISQGWVSSSEEHYFFYDDYPVIDLGNKIINLLRSYDNNPFPGLETNVRYRLWLFTYEGESSPESASIEFVYCPTTVDITPKHGDIRLHYFAGLSDFNMINLDLERDTGLETAVLISLFTDRRAEEDDLLPDNTDDRGGWFGDVTMDIPMGSRLWLLRRSKVKDKIPSQAIEYAKEALQWMIDDNLVSSININAEIIKQELKLKIDIFRPEADPLFFIYFFNWEAQSLRGKNKENLPVQLSLMGGI